MTRLACNLLLLAPLLTATADAHVNGAIYSTDSKGEVLNKFNGKNAAYFAGGPGPNAGCTGNGLTDGTYYFQVTNPSGSVLLSSDDLTNRIVLVSGGVITQTVGQGHATKSGPCGSRVTKLVPFDNTPNGGSEYKIWMTPTASYVPGTGFHGFHSTASKTNNFKIKGAGPPIDQTIIRGTVFYDFNANGVYDPEVPLEVPIAGWKIQIESNGVLTETFSDEDGSYQFIRDMDSSLHQLLSIAPAPGFVPEIGGRWVHTSTVDPTATTNVPEIVLDFGNFFLVNTPTFARSKGYWHNQGEAELSACDPEWRTVLNGLCLRTNFSNPFGQEGTLFTISTGASFSTAFDELAGYLVGDPALGVLAFNLSVQFAAANLNRTCGPMQIPTFIDRFENDVLVPFDEMAAFTQTLLCDPRSANTGPHGDQEWREVIMGCLSEWDGMNSDGEGIFTRSEEQGQIASPY